MSLEMKTYLAHATTLATLRLRPSIIIDSSCERSFSCSSRQCETSKRLNSPAAMLFRSPLLKINKTWTDTSTCSCKRQSQRKARLSTAVSLSHRLRSILVNLVTRLVPTPAIASNRCLTAVSLPVFCKPAGTPRDDVSVCHHVAR